MFEKHTKKISIIFLIFLSFFVFNFPVYALESYLNDDTTSDTSGKWQFIKPLGNGHTTTINSVATKINLDTTATIYIANFKLKYCTSGDACYGGTYVDALSIASDSFTVTPTACQVDGYPDRLKAQAGTDCPLGTEVYIYNDTFDYTMDSDKYYFWDISGGNAGYNFEVVGNEGSGYYSNGTAYGQSCTPYVLDNPSWSPPTSDYYCEETGLSAPYLIINDDFGKPTGSLTDEDSDSVNNELIVEGEFDFKSTGEGYIAKAYFFKQCETTTGEFEIQGHTVANITWYADDDVDNTIDNGDGYYTGAGYTDSNTVGTYSNVRLPFSAGKNCTYPVAIRVLDGDGEIVYNSIDNDEWIELIPTGSTSLIDTPEVEEENVGFFSGLINWVKTYILSFFSITPLKAEFPFYVDYFKNRISVKAPFGYILTALDSDLSSPVVYDNVPNMTVDLTDTPYDLPSVEVDFTEDFDALLNSVRSIFNIVLWFLFFMYFVSLTRRFYK